MTWRSRYQPQLSHTTCGRFTAPQFGQIDRAGASRRQFAARRLRVLARGVLRLGTAMGRLSVSAQVEFGQRRPARVRRRWLFGDDVRRAGSTTGRLARRGERQLEQDDVPHQLLEVDLVALERVRVTLDWLGLEQLADLGRERVLQV